MFQRSFLLTALLVGGALLAPAATGQDEPTLRVNAPLYKTKTKGDGTIKFSPFKSSKDAFQVTVALYDGTTGDPLLQEDGFTPWFETLTVTTLDGAPSSPETGELREASRITGFMDLILGASTALPVDLLQRDATFTTQVTTLKDGEAKKIYEESPPRPLGISGLTGGLAIAPLSVQADSIETTDLDVSGNLTTNSFTTTGSVNASAVYAGNPSSFTGDLGDIVADNSVFADNDLRAGGDVVAQGEVVAGTNVVAVVDVIAADDLVAGDDVIANGNVAAQGGISAGTPSTLPGNGDIVADDDLIADDSVIATAGFVTAGAVVAAVNSGDVAAADDLISDDDAFIGDNLIAGGDVSAARLFAGSPSTTSATGDIVADDDLLADDSVQAVSGTISTGTPTSAFAGGDIAATDDLVADDDLFLGDDAFVEGFLLINGEVVRSTETAASDLFLQADQKVQIVKNFDGDLNFDESVEFWHGIPNSLGSELQMELEGDGDLFVVGNVNANNVDLAEVFPTREDGLGAASGAVVALDPTSPEHVRAASLGSAEVALGIVSTAPGFVLGAQSPMSADPELRRAAAQARMDGDDALADELLAQFNAKRKALEETRVAVALKGRVPVRVDLSFGPIAPGDLLGLSTTPGVAARYNGYGPSIGIAMEHFSGGNEPIVAFVQLDHSPSADWAPANWAGPAVDGAVDDLASDDEDELAAPDAVVEPTLLTGAGTLPVGFDQVIVEQEGLTEEALPVVTFYGNPGGAWWVAERGIGYFVLRLERPAMTDLAFGYTASY